MKKLFLTALVTALFAAPLAAQQVKATVEIRPRYENRQGVKTLLKAGEKGESHVSQRSRFNVFYKQDNILMKLSIQNIRVWGEVGTLASSDNASGIHEAWAQFSLGEDLFDLKLGRQEINYDNGRIFGSAAWAQQSRRHDAAIAKIKPSENSQLDIGFALNNDAANNLESLYSNVAGYKTFQYLWYHTQKDDFGMSLLALNNGIEHIGIDGQETTYSQTFGTRITYKKKNLSYDTSLYFQTGSIKNKSISAYNFAGNIDLKASDEFNIGLGVEYMSGKDMNDTSAGIKSFFPLYGTNHKYNGLMDYFFVGNHANSVGLVDLNATVGYAKDKVSFKMIPHIFKSAGDMYDGGTKISNNLGTELDVIFGYKVSKNITFNAGYSQMFGTRSLEVLKGGDSRKTNSWTWMMLTFKPTLFTSN